MDSVLTCCAGGPGSIPAISKSKKVVIFRCFFLGIKWYVEKMEADTRKLCNLASPCSKYNNNTSHVIYGANKVEV